MVDGRKFVTKTFYGDDDAENFQMTYEWGKSIEIPEIGYQVKLDDPISGNIPFRENVIILMSIYSVSFVSIFLTHFKLYF